MRSYLKNKGFTPKSFLISKTSERENGNKRGILIIFILNIFLIPLSINKLENLKEPIDNSITVSGNLLMEDGEEKNLINWLSKIDNSILSMKIKKNSGELILSTLEDVSNFEEKEELNIRLIEKNDKGNYKINVQG